MLFSLTPLFGQKYAEEPWQSRLSFGANAGVSFNRHSAGFRNLPGIPSCCPRYENGSGIGPMAGLFLAFPLTETIELHIGGDYADRSGVLSAIEPVYVSGPDGNGFPGEFEHTVDASLSTIGGLAMANFRVGNSVRIGGGLRVATIMTKSFEQREEIISPSFGVFEDTGTRIRNQYSGDIPDASALDISLVAMVSFDLPLDAAYEWFLVPQAGIQYSLTPVSSALDWNTISLTAGAGIRYAPREIIPPAAPPMAPPRPGLPSTPPPPALAVDVDVYHLTNDNQRGEVSELRVEEFLTRKTTPILNYVFFEENTAEIPPRYELFENPEKTRDFSTDKLYNQNSIQIYHNVLNIIGRRLKDNPTATINITGCNAGEAEQNNTELSRSRAENVADYLAGVWGIDRSRMQIAARNLPQAPSNPNSPEGREENRRVEISSGAPAIFDPLEITDTTRVFNPPQFGFAPEVESEIGVNNWELHAIYDNDTLRTFSGSGTPPENILWKLDEEFARQLRGGLTQPISYRLAVEDHAAQAMQSPEKSVSVRNLTISNKVRERIGSKEIDKFSLILFGFDQASLGPENRRIVEKARKRIETNSTVKIYGYSDSIGDEEYNERLSRSRALSTARQLGLDASAAEAIGESKLLFDNELPEGRMYCRTVVIEIITPVE